MDLKKSVFITGATQNTGLEVAKSFAGKGYDLHITSRSLESAEKIAYALKQEYPEVQVYPYALDLKNDDYEGIMKNAMEFTGICKA